MNTMIINHLSVIFIGWITFLQTPPQFKDGKNTLEQFLNNNKVYPSYSKNHCIEGTIYVSFKIDHNGNILYAKVDKGLGIDLDDEALRLIKLTSGKWTVSKPTYKTQKLVLPVSFTLDNPTCANKTTRDIKSAIANYQIQEQLQHTVFDYYEKKRKGENDPKMEAQIESLKKELGFDDNFIEQKLKEAQKMIQQKDIESACKTLNIIHKIGSSAADKLIEETCK
ncbi:TonB family protein [Pseudopedobacter beijingensis]|uniref:TonB family protein n=1 Tax=Pseudopedobacter beijingensis TaxID=1207056 RepID=A0ABW4IEI9_9SPHI